MPRHKKDYTFWGYIKVNNIEPKICKYCGNKFLPTPKSPNACLMKYCRDYRK